MTEPLNIIVRDKKKKVPAGAEGEIAELDERLLRSPSIALGYLYQETGKVFSHAMNTLDTAFDAFIAAALSRRGGSGLP